MQNAILTDGATDDEIVPTTLAVLWNAGGMGDDPASESRFATVRVAT